MVLTYPQWQEPLAAAIVEFNPQQLRDKLKTAEEAISKRIEELALEQGDQRGLAFERKALAAQVAALQNLFKQVGAN